MASAELTVAKAALSGALFRADPRSCSRDEIESMLVLLNSAITECSPPNVQKFKHWALSNLVPSSARILPFCKYLVALSNSFGADGDGTRDISQLKRVGGGRVPSAKRRRLHLLYILNDILYHVKFRTRDESFAEKLTPALPALVRSASSFSSSPRHLGKVQDLLLLWEEQGYFPGAFIGKLRAALEEAPLPGKPGQSDAQATSAANSVTKTAKAAPFIMPAMHGDPTTPWYDLPAGNWLPVLEPNSTRPMNPTMIKPLVLAAGPADKNLADAVKQLLANVEKIYSQDVNLDAPPPDVGQMGEFLDVDEINGEVLGGETYYGWSRAFCKKMRARKRGEHDGGRGEERGRARSTRSTGSPRSYSRSLSRSRTPRHSRSGSRNPTRPAFKRSRLSTSPKGKAGSRSRSRSRSRNRSRSPRSNRGTSDPRDRGHQRPIGHSRSRSRSASPYRTFQPRSPSYGHSRSRSRSPGSPPGHHNPYLPSGLPPRPTNNANNDHHFFPPNPQQPPAMQYPIPPMPDQLAFGHFPIPMPPPPNLQLLGQWMAPSPSPHPPPMAGQPPQPPFFHGFTGGWAGPPPPPPPPPPQDHFQHGRGGAGNYRGMPGGRGGGGYGRGGDRWW